MDSRENVTDLLARAADGDREALDHALPLVYDELRRLARRQLRGEAAGHTLNTCALVHEAYLRLSEQPRGTWCDRAHFFAVAAIAMRRILVDHARRRRAAKRGAGAFGIPLDGLDGAPVLMDVSDPDTMLPELDDALMRLERLDARLVRVVECRFFAGFTEAETANALGIGLRTVKRDWARARSWLYKDLHPDVGRA